MSKNSREKIGVVFSDNYKINSITLKKAILSFDKIKIIDANTHNNLIDFGVIEDRFIYPNGKSMTFQLGDYGALIKLKNETSEFNDFLDEIDIALKKNIISVINPNKILSKKARILRLTYDYDLANNELMSIASKGINKKILENNKTIDIESGGGIFTGLSVAPSGFISPWSLMPKPTDEPFNNITDKDLKESIKLLTWTRIVKVLTVITIAEEFFGIPVTDNEHLNNIILYKYKWLSSIDNKEIKDNILINKNEDVFKYNLLCQSIISDIFTDEQLEEISLRKLLAYKKASNEELWKFKNKIDRISNLIETEVWEDKLKDEINKLISKDIMPDVNNYIEKKIELKERLIGNIIKATPDALSNSIKFLLPITMIKNSLDLLIQKNIAFMLPGFSLSEIILFSGLLGVHILKETVKSIVDNYIENRKEKRKNSMTYLLKLNKK